MSIQEVHSITNHSISDLCRMLEVSRSGFYKWIKKPEVLGPSEEDWISDKIIELYTLYKGILGVRRMKLYLNRVYGRTYNVKRIRRLMRRLGLQSVIRRKRKNYVRSTPQITAENLLNRDFSAEVPNQKWLTDVTEFKYGQDNKAYLSAILDLGDNSIVSYIIGHSNNNALVFNTFNRAIKDNPEAKPLFHSDRGFQYTSKAFRKMLDDTECTQSMSRVSRCIDNGPMEGFWGILKSEMYYLNKFDDYSSLEQAIEEYIHFYNTKRYQKKYKGLAPLEVRNQAFAA
ncbi:MAG TPA: IS3 family transposase [Eubacteriaceae bacterium]|nr:IS3 family transposase [Eubacteriaceae bacterium]